MPPLPMYKEEKTLPKRRILGTKSEQKIIDQARWDREWLLHAERYDVQKNARQRLRIERTWEAILKCLPVQHSVDLACGLAPFIQRLGRLGYPCDALDIASAPLGIHAKRGDIKIVQAILPETPFATNSYDLIICTDVIGDLSPKNHRLLLSELSRIITVDGHIIISSSLDIYSEYALEKFCSLLTSEFEIIDYRTSHHQLHIRLCDFLKTPQRYYYYSQNRQERKKHTQISSLFFRINTSKFLGKAWGTLAFCLSPLVYFTEQKSFILRSLEKISRFIWKKEASHIIIQGKRRGLGKRI